MNADTILGINPGTRFISIAISRNGALVHFQIRVFQGVWSQKKLKKIIEWLDGITRTHKVTGVAIKIPDTFPSSANYIRLIGALNIFLQSKGLECKYYTLSEVLKRHCGDRTASRIALSECITKKFPELLIEYKKERRNVYAHYYRLFEAVAVAIYDL